MTPGPGTGQETCFGPPTLALGVRHYWLGDPEARRLDCYRSEAGGYAFALQGEGDAALAHPDWPELTLNLADLWR